MTACVVIPIKTTNRRLPGKNTRLLCGKPLYAYVFTTVKQVRGAQRIYVDSSDQEILKTARGWGFDTLLRPPEYNADSITGDELLLRIADTLEYDIIGLVHVTSPFLRAEPLDKAIQWLEEDPMLDSVFGALPRYNRFWYRDQPLNHDPNKLLPTQALTPIYEESDIYFVRRRSLLTYRHRVCGKHKIVETGKIESLDIDTIEDFQLAEAVMRLQTASAEQMSSPSGENARHIP